MSRPTPLVDHDCSYYCRGSRHALPCLADPTCTRLELIADHQWTVERTGWQVLDARPAREADTAQWRAQSGWVAGDSGRAMLLPPIPAHYVAWLILVEPQLAEE